ncbi:unnamed protein product, partial [Urochloa humidicola]
SLAVSAFFSHVRLLNWTWTGATSEARERAAMPLIRAVTGEIEAKMRIVDRDLCAISDGARAKATLKASTGHRPPFSDPLRHTLCCLVLQVLPTCIF